MPPTVEAGIRTTRSPTTSTAPATGSPRSRCPAAARSGLGAVDREVEDLHLSCRVRVQAPTAPDREALARHVAHEGVLLHFREREGGPIRQIDLDARVGVPVLD